MWSGGQSSRPPNAWFRAAPCGLEEKCPRLPAATITALTAATCGVLTGFVSFRPTDLGHASKTTRARNGGQPRLRAENPLSAPTVPRHARAWTGCMDTHSVGRRFED